MLEGKVTAADLTYKRKAHLIPTKHYYGDGSIKYSCPLCDMLENKHSVSEGMLNCPLCNVNLTWEDDNE